MESEEKLQNEVLALRQKVKNLEAHIGTILKSQPKEMDLTSYDEILAKSVEIQNKYITLVDDYQREKKNNEKLQNTLKKLESDKNRLKDSLGVVKEEKELLISKLTLVECKKDEIKSDFDRVKAQLKAKDEECRWLQTRVKEFSDVEAKQQVDAVDKMNNELVNFERKCNTSLESMVRNFLLSTKFCFHLVLVFLMLFLVFRSSISTPDLKEATVERKPWFSKNVIWSVSWPGTKLQKITH